MPRHKLYFTDEERKAAQARRSKKWSDANPEKRKQHDREYRLRNREKLRDYLKKWRKKNKELRNAQARREYEKRADHYIAVVREAGDAQNPGRPIRRLARQYRDGRIERDELIEGIVNKVSGKAENNL